MAYPEKFFSLEEEREIVKAIRQFEMQSSGEIRVHVEHRLRRPPVAEAIAVFNALGMRNTTLRNGVIILLAPEQNAFSIYGDVGINEVVPEGFWTETIATMKPFFAEGKFKEGLVKGIEIAGLALAKYFPRKDDDVNELPDEISYSK